MSSSLDVGDALKPVRDAVRHDDIEQVAALCAAAGILERGLGRRVADRLFNVLINHHPRFLGDAQQLQGWLVDGASAWRRSIARQATSPTGLRATVDAALKDLHDWTPKAI